jgi:RNA methyltransferase, TrmH family
MHSFKSISSKDNPQYKRLKDLVQSGKDRQQHGVFVVEGIHLAQAAQRADLEAEQTFVAQSAFDHPEINAQLQSLQTNAQANAKANAKASTQVYVLSDALFRSVSALEQGVSLLQTYALPELELGTTVTQTLLHRANAVYLENIQDPGNLGTVLRTAAAAGCQTIFLSGQCADPWSPKVLRAGMGAHFALNLVKNCGTNTLFEAWNAPVIATSLDAQQSIHQLNLTVPTLWCFGNEGAGLQLETLQAIQSHPQGQLAIIPQSSAVESLNIAAAAAVCLFEQSRQQHGAAKK